MVRWVAGGLAVGLMVVAGAADPPAALTPVGRRKLEAERNWTLAALETAFAEHRLLQAEQLARHVLSADQRLHPGDNPDVAGSLVYLANVLQAQGKLAVAEPHLRDALAMYRRLHQGDHTDLASSLGNMAHVLQVQGKLAAAEPLYREALAMRRRLFPADHPDVAASLNNLAFLLSDLDKRASIEPLLREALAMRRRLFPADHPAVATSLNNLAAALSDQGRPAAAEPLYRDALAMRRRLAPGDHPDVATSLNNLAHVLSELGHRPSPAVGGVHPLRTRPLTPGATMTDLSTDELDLWVQRLAAGDPAARDRLLAHTRGRLQRMVGKMLHGGFARLEAFEQTDDVVQGVYVKLLRDWDGFAGRDGQHPLASAAEYLMRAAKLIRQELIDLSRKHHGRGAARPQAVPLAGADESGPAVDPGTDTHDPAALAVFTDFHRAVDELPEPLRSVVDLHWYQGLTHQETADLLGIAEVTSRKRWADARLRLADRVPGIRLG